MVSFVFSESTGTRIVFKQANLFVVSIVHKASHILCPLYYNFNCMFSVPFDLAFVVDGANIVGPSTFKLITELIKSIYHVYPVSAKGTHVGMVTYSRTGNMVFNFKQHRSMKSLDMAVDQLKLPGGTNNNVGAGLAATHSQLFGTSGRKRKQIKKAMVTFLVGKPDDDPTTYAKKLKSEDIVSVVVAINSDMNSVKLIASSPDHILFINYPAQLIDFVDKIIEMINKGTGILSTFPERHAIVMCPFPFD